MGSKQTMHWLVCVGSAAILVLPAQGDTVWFFGANSVSNLESQTGLSTAGRGESVAWKDAQLNYDRPLQRGGTYSTAGVIQRNPGPPQHGQAHVVISFRDIFGVTGDRIRPGSEILSGKLWLYHDYPAGDQTITVRGLSPDDGAWIEDEATFSLKAVGTPWANDAIDGAFTNTYGTFTNPPPTNAWFEVPVDLKEAITDYGAGTIGGIALVAVATPTPGGAIGNVYFHSDEHWDVRTRPGLWVQFTSPRGSGTVVTCR